MSVDWMGMDESLNPQPRFYVEPADGVKTWSEIKRQVDLFRIMKMTAPKAFGFAIPNAGKRNPMKAKQENILAGVFDTQWILPNKIIAFVELKGYSKNGTAGKLSKQQIDFGNNLVRLDIPCACFFSPVSASNWLTSMMAQNGQKET